MENNINILYIITKLELGGAQKVCLNLAKGLNDFGYNSILISGKEGKLLKEAETLNHVILLDNLKREVSIKAIFFELKNFFELIKKIKLLKKQYPNLVVHTHSTKAGIVGRWAALFAGVKKRVHTIHGYAFHKNQNKLLWLAIYSLELITSLITTHFVCVSSADIKIGKKLFPRFNKKHSLIRAAVESDKFIPAIKIPKIENNQFIFGTVACFKKQKNLIDLFKAFEKVTQKFSNCSLEVIGDGKLRKELESWITEHNLENKIILHGWQDNVAEFMINWNTFVLSSLWEGLPCAIIEARLLKLPVLCYDTGGISDVIENGKNGILYKQGDWENLANGMIKIIENKNLYSQFKNYKEDLSEFDNVNMVKKHIELYNQL